jgi:alkanesulfonate monooxygenase SsuD/methylene tetrahydromethanopterin reductase-like flavin-dependent oxidoreductase (luciferase family)
LICTGFTGTKKVMCWRDIPKKRQNDMNDYQQDVRFGANVDPTANDPSWPLRLTHAIERAGLEYIGIQDHPYNSRFLDTWTLIATLLQATERVHIFPNVANLPLRPPVMLAKAAATLDVLSGGRVELGLGAGAFREGIEAMGGPGRSKGESIEAMEEAVQIIHAYWSGTRALHFEGKHYSVKGAHPGPRPTHSIGLWLGSYGPRSLRVLGRLADGWLPSSSYAPPERLPEMQQRIDDAALAADRQPREIRRIYNIMGMITDGPVQDPLTGPLEYWIDELTRLVVEVGMDTFIYWPADDRMPQIELFAAEVAPAVKDQVAKVRGIT